MAKRRTPGPLGTKIIIEHLELYYHQSTEQDPKNPDQTLWNYEQPWGPDPIAKAASSASNREIAASSVTHIAEQCYGRAQHSNKSMAKYYELRVRELEQTVIELKAEIRHINGQSSLSNIRTHQSG